MVRVFVDGEARAVGGDLQQRTAGFLDVDRLEPEPVDDARRMPAGLDHATAQLVLVSLVRGPPGDVVHRTHTPLAPLRVGVYAHFDPPAGQPVANREPGPLAVALAAGEPERPREERRRRRLVALDETHTTEASDLTRGGYRACVPAHRVVSLPVDRLDEREPQTVRVDERQHPLVKAPLHGPNVYTGRLQTVLPVREAAAVHGERDLRPLAGPVATGRHRGPGKEGEVRAGAPGRVGEIEVIGVRDVLVDRAFDHPHAQNAGVEVVVLLRVAGDGGDVV